MFVYAAEYESVDDAKADLEVLKELHRDKFVGTYDAAVLTKTDEGKVKIVDKTEKPTQHGGLAGLAVGAAILSNLSSFDSGQRAGEGWWVTEAGNLVYANFVVWGIVDSIIALIALYAGIDLLRGGTFGLGMGYLFAVVGAIRWLFVVPAAPVLAVVMVALCVMVAYGLTKHSDYAEGA